MVAVIVSLLREARFHIIIASRVKQYLPAQQVEIASSLRPLQ